MLPDPLCVQFLEANPFIRNVSFDRLLDRYHNVIPINSFICYTVGIVDSKRVVNAFQFLFESSNTKIKSYFIRWWNTAAVPNVNFNSVFESIEFWVHSGMTLRKNFFLYDDRMSLLRSTFIYDPHAQYYYRLINLIDYISIPQKSNYQQQIFTSPSKFNYNFKHSKLKSKKSVSVEEKQISKSLCKILQSRNQKCYLEKVSPSLLQEIEIFLCHGNPSGI
jgi:hypothetical protein